VTQEERDPEDLGGEYGFRAGLATEWDYVDGEMLLQSSYVVELPHQCDAWEITRRMVKAEAIAEMEKFIAEANAALDKLRESS
jgi:hypothetical protein